MDIRRLFRCMGRGTWMLIGVGATLLYLTAADFVISIKPAVSFEDMLDGKEVKVGSRVAGEVVFAMDYFASESTYTRYEDGSRSGSRKSGNYYLIPTAEGYIALKSRQADVSALDALSEETFEYMNNGPEPSTVIHMQGKVERMEGTLAGYYEEYLEELGYSEAEIDAFGEPLVIRYLNFIAVQSMFAAALLILFLDIFFLQRRYRRAGEDRGFKRAEDLPDPRSY
ncbi:MAG: hypothetical protein HFG14_03190 [Lachnospiraceae bacterium]|jgi:hypothetical protein|nr:hypothetical protein [Lachnospiraceae bacterium]NBJ82593.1 hypothetical protein [bacterium 1XD42-76]NBK05886.1 hypothetical protein [bacterium 1XD42-94]